MPDFNKFLKGSKQKLSNLKTSKPVRAIKTTNKKLFQVASKPNKQLKAAVATGLSASERTSGRVARPDRIEKANEIKAVFNLLWDRAVALNQEIGKGETLSYRDVVRISDAIRAEGPGMLETTHLPHSIDRGLTEAVARIEATGSKKREKYRKLIVALLCALGLAIAAISLRSIQSQSAISRFFFGTDISPLEVVGIAGGILMFVSGLYVFFQQDSPKERAQEAHKIFMICVDEWMYESLE